MTLKGIKQMLGLHLQDFFNPTKIKYSDNEHVWSRAMSRINTAGHGAEVFSKCRSQVFNVAARVD